MGYVLRRTCTEQSPEAASLLWPSFNSILFHCDTTKCVDNECAVDSLFRKSATPVLWYATIKIVVYGYASTTSEVHKLPSYCDCAMGHTWCSSHIHAPTKTAVYPLHFKVHICKDFFIHESVCVKGIKSGPSYDWYLKKIIGMNDQQCLSNEKEWEVFPVIA